MNKKYCFDRVEHAKIIAEDEQARLFELSGYGAEENESLLEEIQEFFPDFVIEEGKHYLVDYK